MRLMGLVAIYQRPNTSKAAAEHKWRERTAIARGLRQRRPRPGDRWHLDEMVVRIAARRMTCGAPSTRRAKSSIC